MELYSLTAALLIPLGLGYVVLRFLPPGKNLPFLLSLALAFGLGTGMLTQWMLLLDIFSIRFSANTINMPLIVFLVFTGVGVWTLTRTRYPRKEPLPGQVMGTPQKQLRFSMKALFVVLCVVYVVVMTAYVFWRALSIPIESYDALVKISYKAKIFFFDRKIHLLRLPHNYYPLQVPLLQSWVSFVLGRWDDYWTKIFFPLYFSSYLIIQFYFLKTIADKYKALMGAGLLVSSNLFIFHATIAYMDFTIMYYNCVALLLMILWHRSETKEAWLMTAGLFSGMMTFVKSEGTVYLIIHVILLLVLLKQLKGVRLKEKISHFLRFIIPSAGVCSIFSLYKIIQGVAPFGHDRRMIWDFGMSSITRLPKVMAAYADDLFLSGNWSLLWFVFFFLIIFNRKKLCFYSRWLSLALGLFFLVYTGLALTTRSFAYIGGEYTELGLSRLILHFFPLIIPGIILAYDAESAPVQESYPGNG